MNSIFPEELMKDEEKHSSIIPHYRKIRMRTELICEPLLIEDYVIQPAEFVSPPKWHLAHSTWFFENFLLKQFISNYKVFNPDFHYLFNSYYESEGNRVLRVNRGNLSRPGVEEIFAYRKHVDAAIEKALRDKLFPLDGYKLLELGLQHEQQHQELLITDIKFILGTNPLFPSYYKHPVENENQKQVSRWIDVDEGIYEIGYRGKGFCYDNEQAPHKVYLNQYKIASAPVTNAEYIDFINDGGYSNFNLWQSDGWNWINEVGVVHPLYWHIIDGHWFNYTLEGLREIDPEAPVNHISYYEAYAFSQWRGARLPTEFEWEAAADLFNWGQRWEWTNSAYLEYPGYKKPNGALGEYNGKFMINQMVLRGGSEATTPGHGRKTYRNFFQPHFQWQYSGIRLVK